jgi:WD40 repeat protein
MHKEQLSFVTVTPVTDFVITSSIDGFVKFWKKMADGIEFVKEFRAHPGEIRSTSVSADGRSFATAGTDKTVKIFDVITFGKPGHSILLVLVILLTVNRSSGHVYTRLRTSMCLLGASTGCFSAVARRNGRVEQHNSSLRWARREFSASTHGQDRSSHSGGVDGLQQCIRLRGLGR